MATVNVTNVSLRDQFFQRCFDHFGSMNKNDYEVELMHLLLENGDEEKSDHYLSTLLKIPVSKVKRLRYEADLQHPKDVDYYRKSFYEIITTRSFKTDNNGNLMFSVNNKALREYLNECIEQAGSFFDSSFVGNIVKLTPTDFILLIAEFENKDDLVKRVKDSIAQNNKELPKDLLEKGASLLKATFKDLASHFAPNVVKYILDELEKNNKIKQL